MLYGVDGLIIEAPFGFAPESETVCFRAAPSGAGALRPNLVFHRRPAARGASLADCAASIVRELSAAVPGIGTIASADLRFADGARGVVLSYEFPAASLAGVSIAQLQALRLDGATLATLAFTVPAPELTGARRAEVLRAFASLGSTGGAS